jgi:metal-responsive CopG/Arc/MetJ family transcriptional regulator
MRISVTLDDELVAALDKHVGRRQRNAFVGRAVERALADERWQAIISAVGSISEAGHAWDDDAAAWVRAQRGAGERHYA